MATQEPTAAFWYILITVYSVAVVVSIVILVGLLIPLLIQLKNGSFYRGAISQRRGSASAMLQRRGSGSSSIPQRRGSSNLRVSRASFSQRRPKDPTYSTYNLYLVYLAIADLVCFLPMIIAGPSELSNRISDYVFMLSVPYTVANLWINAVIIYEVLILLKKSTQGQRITQPSLTRVNLQGGGVVFGSVLFGLFNYYSYNLKWVGPALYLGITLLLAVIPFAYAIGVTISVRWRGLIAPLNGSTPGHRAVRGLVLYFFRVTIVFVAIWLPTVVLLVLYYYVYEDSLVLLYIPPLLAAVQPIITFCMILTKPDVKKYIRDLVTLTYIFGGDCSCCGGNVEAELVGMSENTNEGEESTAQAKSVTILGYEFADMIDAESTGESISIPQEEEVGVN